MTEDPAALALAQALTDAIADHLPRTADPIVVAHALRLVLRAFQHHVEVRGLESTLGAALRADIH